MAMAAPEDVLPFTPAELVVPRAAFEIIMAVATKKEVITSVTFENVIAELIFFEKRANEMVVTWAAFKNIVPFFTVNLVSTRATQNRIIARPSTNNVVPA